MFQAPRDGNDLRRLAAVGLMTSGVVHDVNNLLQSVTSVLRMIDRRSASGSREDLAGLAADGLRALDRASSLSRRLMTFGRPGDAAPRLVEVNTLLRDLEPLLRWTLGSSVLLKLALDEAPLETWCDPRDLENAIVNLAVNARDAMPDGGLLFLRTLGARLAPGVSPLAGGEYLIITASDTGEGMTPQVAARAFEPFYTTRIGEGGSGMGLASVRAFVEAAGGAADIASPPGEGATVRLYLPRVPPPDLAVAAAAGP